MFNFHSFLCKNHLPSREDNGRLKLLDVYIRKRVTSPVIRRIMEITFIAKVGSSVPGDISRVYLILDWSLIPTLCIPNWTKVNVFHSLLPAISILRKCGGSKNF